MTSSMTSSATMSFYDFLDFSLCDPTPLDISLTTDEDLPIGQFLEPLSSASELHWLSTSSESTIDASNNYSSLSLDVLEHQPSTTPLEPTVWIHELIGSAPFAPPTSDIVPDIPKHFDGQIITEDSVGKVPKLDGFSTEDDKFKYVFSFGMKIYMNISPSSAILYPDPAPYDPTDIPSTPIQRPLVPVSKERFLSPCSSITSSDDSDTSPSRNRVWAAVKQANSKRTARIKGPELFVPFYEPKDERPAKTRKTFNSACAAEDLASFAPFITPRKALPIPSVNTSCTVSPQSTSSLSDPSYFESPHLSPPEALTTRKRKLKEINADDEDVNWDPVGKPYSRHTIRNTVQYRCDLCFAQGMLHSCIREGDMVRHLETLKHKPRGHICPNSPCKRQYTRADALKRHMKNCKF